MNKKSRTNRQHNRIYAANRSFADSNIQKILWGFSSCTAPFTSCSSLFYICCCLRAIHIIYERSLLHRIWQGSKYMRNDDKLLSLNGVQYARAITAGARWLSDREKQLDDINLFPVPDADTGTNMKGTVILLAENPGILPSNYAWRKQVSVLLKPLSYLPKKLRCNSGTIFPGYVRRI